MSDIQIGRLLYEITGDSKKLEEAINKSQKKASGFKKLLLGLGGAFAFKKIVDGFIAITRAGSDLAESQNAASKVFKDSTSIIDNYAKTANKSVGLSKKAFNELATVTGAQFKAAGIETDKAAEQTINLTERAADLASVYNTSVSDALSALGAGLRGETEPARRFAITINEAAIEQEALASGLINSKNELTEAIKIQARYNLILKQSEDTVGDFVDTSDGLANGQRILAATFEDIQAKLGGPLAKVFASTGSTLNDLAQDFNDFLDTAEGLEFVNGLAKSFAVSMAILGGSIKQLGSIFTSLFDVAKSGFSGLIKSFQSLTSGDFSGALDAIKNSGVEIKQTYQDFSEETVENFKKTFKGVSDVIAEDFNKIEETAENGGETLVDTTKKTAEQIQREWKLAGEKNLAIFEENFNNIAGQAEMFAAEVISLLGSIDEFQNAKLENDLARIDEETQARLEAAGVQEETELQKLENQLEAAKAAGDTQTQNELEQEIQRVQIIQDGEKQKAQLQYEADLKSYKLGLLRIGLEGAIAQIRAVSAGLQAGFPAAFVVMPILGALALTGTVLALAAARQSKPTAPAFEQGGFVPGNSFSGDNVMIRANSGEAVLNTDQQKNFMDIANGGKTMGQQITLNLVSQTGRTLKKWIFDGTKDGTIKIDDSSLVSVGI